MNALFMGEVEHQVHRDWEKRFNRRTARRSSSIKPGRHDPLRSLVEKLKQAF
jgi:hypothetical protein